MIVLSFPRSGRNWLMLQIVYYALPESINIHPLNALQLLSKACHTLGTPLKFTHGEYHRTDKPKHTQADIVLTRDFEQIAASYSALLGKAEQSRYERMLADNPHAWKFDYGYRLEHPEQAFTEFLSRIGAPMKNISAALEASSKARLKTFSHLQYIKGITYESA